MAAWLSSSTGSPSGEAGVRSISSVLPLAGPTNRRDGRQIGGMVGGFLLGAVLLVAAYAKLLDPASFGEQIGNQGLSFGLDPLVFSWLALALEVGLGVALLLGVRTRAVLVTATLLVTLFLVLTGREYVRELRGLPPSEVSCGCFGNLVERTPAQAFWQDALLLVPALGLAWWGRTRDGSARKRLALALGAALVAGLFATVAPALPLDDLATRLQPGRALADLCGGPADRRVCLTDAVPELAAGRHWVVIADLEDPAFAPQVAALNESARRLGDEVSLVVVTASSAEAQHAFFWQTGPAFEIREAPLALLRPLYRALPRSFLVDSGRVVETASGVAPALARAAG